jgi:hypothetical protein
MGLLSQLAVQFKTLSIVGMAKNAGKTTALNYLIDEAMDEGLRLGITSTGRDGELIDLVTGTDKPRIFIETGTLVSIPSKLYELADAGLEILSMTGYSTPLGQILICRAAESGYVQIAGPLNVKDHKKLCREMLSLGADLVLIDGAVDRKSVAAPGISDGVILATGAVISRSLKKVVEETQHVANLYGLPMLADEPAKGIILDHQDRDQIILIDRQHQFKFLNLKTGLSASRFLDEIIDDQTAFVYIPGALTQSVVSDIHPARFKQLQFIIKDPTRIFIEANPWQILVRRGFKVRVLDSITLAAITVNPYSPAGYSFEHEALLGAMRAAITTIPIMDVKFGGDFDEACQYKDKA